VPVRHLPPTATVDEVSEVLGADGCVVIDDLVDPGELDRLETELAPFMANTPYGDDFSGHQTRRTGGLVARPPRHTSWSCIRRSPARSVVSSVMRPRSSSTSRR
jgi:hypothetical protein